MTIRALPRSEAFSMARGCFVDSDGSCTEATKAATSVSETPSAAWPLSQQNQIQKKKHVSTPPSISGRRPCHSTRCCFVKPAPVGVMRSPQAADGCKSCIKNCPSLRPIGRKVRKTSGAPDLSKAHKTSQELAEWPLSWWASHPKNVSKPLSEPEWL